MPDNVLDGAKGVTKKEVVMPSAPLVVKNVKNDTFFADQRVPYSIKLTIDNQDISLGYNHVNLYMIYKDKRYIIPRHLLTVIHNPSRLAVDANKMRDFLLVIDKIDISKFEVL